MRGNDLLDRFGLIDPAYIEAAEAGPPKKLKRIIILKRCAAIAACFILFASLCFGIYAYAAEAKEYNAAVRFFDEHGLSTEGLTRGEIKEVYRDIVTRSFSYSKTSDVIVKSLSEDQVNGYEIVQDDPTPEDIENLWNYKNHKVNAVLDGDKSIYYRCYSDERMDDVLGFAVHNKSYIEKYENDALVWRAEISEFEFYNYKTVSDGVIVYGKNYTYSSEQRRIAWMAKIDNGGNVLWKLHLDNGFENEYIAAVLENSEGGYDVISRGELSYFCLSRYTPDGVKYHSRATEIGNFGIQNVARFGDGYVVQLLSLTTDEHARIVKVDNEGSVTGSFSYSSEKERYYIADMIEYNGNIYLSAYAVPKPEGSVGGREIDAVLKYLHDKGIHSITSEELTPLVRKNYTALLLLCDPDTGIPMEFYSVRGSKGGKLSVSEDGELLWDVESITTTFYSPYTSSFTIGGSCYVFRYTFSDNGALIRQEKTGETTVYRD